MAPDTLEKLKQLHAEAREALDDTALARRQEHEQTRLQRFLHFWALVGRSFARNRGPARAAALTYASLLALVPMLAVMLGITGAFLKHQGEEPIQRLVAKLVESVTPAARPVAAAAGANGAAAGADSEALARARLVEETRQRITAQIMAFVGNLRGGTLGASGVVGLLAMVLFMLARIEDAFNDIWGVTRGRPWHLRVIQYWFAISLGPLSSASTVALTSGPYLVWVRELMDRLGVAGEMAVKLGLTLLPYALLSAALGLLYFFMPNTRVQWQAAAVGGLVAGTLWQLNQAFSVFYVSRVISNSAIYGSLGAIPVFMVGLYVSWILLLLGAQVAYVYQNRRAYLQERQVEQVNQRSREFAALRLLTRIGACFARGEPPTPLTRLAEELGVPMRLANQVLGALQAAGLVAEVAGREPAFVPARPLAQITVADVLRVLRVGTGRDLNTRSDPVRQMLQEELAHIEAAEEEAAGRVTLQDLVRRAVGG